MDMNEFTGIWKLQFADFQNPGHIHIAEHYLDIRPDGTVEFASKMSGQFAGMTLNGCGTWTQNGDILSWTIGENTTDTSFTLRSDVLAFDCDPVLLKEGKTPMSTEYSRAT